MEEVVRLINECNNIRFPSYRTAAKMQVLQRELNMQHVQLDLVAGVFECHRLSVTENSLSLDIYEIEDVLSDIYFAAQKDTKVNFSVSYASKLGVDYICKLFSKQYNDNIPVFSIKVALTLICCGKLEDKYGYLYHELADHNACLSRTALNTMLANVCKITEMLGECVTYGGHLIQPSIDDCFKESPGCLGISEAQFALWLKQEPSLLIWISTFNRLKSAENIVHDIKCSTCKTAPVKGPRYSCLRCGDYHQCQTCFLQGKTSSKHKLKHPVREYCVQTNDKEVSKVLMKLIRSKLRLCVAQGAPTQVEATCSNSKMDETVKSENATGRLFNDPQKELQSIIYQLEKQNRQLQAELLGISDTKVEKLQQHRTAIELQLKRLKELKNCLFTQSSVVMEDANMIQSTPMVRSLASKVRPLPLAFELSPIICQDSVNYDDELGNSNVYSIQEDEGLATSPEVTSALNDVTQTSEINLSTWIGGGERTTIGTRDSGFSQWINSVENDSREARDIAKSSNHNWTSFAGPSPVGIIHNAVSSLQLTEKNSQHSSLQNVQGDLKDILDRLQNMVANDTASEDTFAMSDKDADRTCFI